MLLSIAYIILFGLLGSAIFKAIKLPGLIGMLFAGIVIGPFVFGLLDESILAISLELRMIALIVILLHAGLGINKEAIVKVGKKSVFLAFIPALLEGFFILFLAMSLLEFSFYEAGTLGFIIAAVSPAVVVPAMLKLMNDKQGRDKNIPVMILGGASLDDVIVITIFSVFTSLYLGTNISVGAQLLNIPLAISLGVILGGLTGYALIKLFTQFHMRDSKKVLIMLGASLVLVSLEYALEEIIMIAGLLGVMMIGLMVTELNPKLGKRLSMKFNKIWVFTELLLFVLVGAAVNIDVALDAGLLGLLIILLGLCARSIGVIIALAKSDLNYKEKLFTVFAYTPKATVQAAIGSIPLSLGYAQGEVILALAVLSIIITAPIGAILIDKTAPLLLTQDV